MPRILQDGPLLRVLEPAVDARAFRDARRALEAVGARASYWKTFWFPLDASPTSQTERLALQLRQHLPDGSGLLGVEWWIGRMDPRDVPLDFHHDRDLALFEQTGRLAHPRYSSVLFFNRVRGGSLFVTDQRLRRRGDVLTLSPAQPRQYATARPGPNRFAIFPGNLLHGVLDARDQVPDRPLDLPPGPMRLSVVFNWWVRRPRDVPLFSERRVYRELALSASGQPKRASATRPLSSKRTPSRSSSAR